MGGSKKIVYRLYCRPPVATTLCGGNLARKYIVQWAYHDRETGENSEWHDWDSKGIPEHSPDALVTIPYGSGSVSDGKFPVWVCEPASNPEHIGKVLGYNSPNYEAPPGAVNPQRVIIIPEWDLRPGSVIHHIVCGDMTIDQINNWSQHWGSLALQRFLDTFGTTRPNPNTQPAYVTRAVYCQLHHTLTYQAVQLIGGQLNWSNTDAGEPPRHPLGTSVVGQIFGGTGVDLPQSYRPFRCTTVLGIHFNPTSATLSNYSYSPFAHYRMTGSVEFQRIGCEQDPCGDPTNPITSLQDCPDIPPTESGIAVGNERNRPSLLLMGQNVTNLFGYNTPPENRDDYILGSDGAHLDNEIWRNYWIHRVAWQLCNLNNNVVELKTELIAELKSIVNAIQNQTINTTGIENKISELTSKLNEYKNSFDDAFKLTL